MKRFTFFFLALWGGLTAGLSFAQDSLSLYLDSLIAYTLPPGSEVGLSVYDLTDHRQLYAYRAEKLSRPASNMKLLTAIASLDQSRADEPFVTEVWRKGTLQGTTLTGDLYVVGGFDPEFDERALDSLVAQIAASGITAVSGQLYGDVSMKDSIYWGAGWAWDDTPDTYQPYLSPLMLNKGVVTVKAVAGKRGHKADLTLTPASTYYRVENHTISRRNSAGRFRVTRNWLSNGNLIQVSGNVNRAEEGAVNIYGSQHFFMQTLADKLRARGIRVSGGYAYRELVIDDDTEQIGLYETPMQTALNQLMKESDNLNAEAFLYRLGAQTTGKKYVSAKDGISVICELTARLNLNPDAYRFADGSGLSGYNYLSPDLLVEFLKYAYNRPDIYAKLLESLPVAGIDGTLKNRMKSGSPAFARVHAKTGTVTGISTLSGYLRAANGHELAFSVMNQNILSGARARAFQDEVCKALVELPR